MIWNAKKNKNLKYTITLNHNCAKSQKMGKINKNLLKYDKNDENDKK